MALPGIVFVENQHDDLFATMAARLRAAALEAVEQRGVCHIAVSGGGTPEPFYMRLVTDPAMRDLPWGKTHLWIVDERWVPENDERSNTRMIRESLASHVPIGPGRYHAVSVDSDDPAAAYEDEMSDVFGLSKHGDEVPCMDFMLLGMGGDAHTASLFPQSPALNEQNRWVVVNDGERVVPPARITMTWPLINHARNIMVLVLGESKAEMLGNLSQRWEELPLDTQEYPILALDPRVHGGRLAWCLDRQSAARLD